MAPAKVCISYFLMRAFIIKQNKADIKSNIFKKKRA